MSDGLAVARGVSWRVLHMFFTSPAFLLPSLAFPLFFFAAFVGGLSRISQVPGFDFPTGYTAFQFVFVLLQSAAFAGVFTGFGIARDFESGFMRRLMLAAPTAAGSCSAMWSRAAVGCPCGVGLSSRCSRSEHRREGSICSALCARATPQSRGRSGDGCGERLRNAAIRAGAAMPVFLLLFFARASRSIS